MAGNRANRYEYPMVVGFDGDPTDYLVLNWSRTGMLVEYDGPLVVGDTGTLVRMWLDDDVGMQAVRPRRFRVVRQRGLESALDFLTQQFTAGFELAEGGNRGEGL